jgi:hypothetical protein
VADALLASQHRGMTADMRTCRSQIRVWLLSVTDGSLHYARELFEQRRIAVDTSDHNAGPGAPGVMAE